MSLDVKKDRGPSNLKVVVIYQSEISHTFSRRRTTQGRYDGISLFLCHIFINKK